MDTLLTVFDQIMTKMLKNKYKRVTSDTISYTFGAIVDYLKNYLMDEENYNGN